MKSWNFIKLLIVLNFVTAIEMSMIVLAYCCKQKSFLDKDIWFKCPLEDDGDNRVARFCQMECIANQFGFSNGTHIQFDKVDEFIASLKPYGQKTVDMHVKATNICKKVTKYQMTHAKFDDGKTSNCSGEFTFFTICLMNQINNVCSKEDLKPSFECKSQAGFQKPVTQQIALIFSKANSEEPTAA